MFQLILFLKIKKFTTLQTNCKKDLCMRHRLLISLGVFTMVFVCQAAGSDPSAACAAALRGDNAPIQSIIVQGSINSARDTLGRNVLMCASATGNLALVDSILKHNPQINDSDTYGGNALIWAVYGGNLNIVKRLVHVGITYNPKGIIWKDLSKKSGVYYGSPLNCAVGRWRASLAMQAYLIDSCHADVNELEYTVDSYGLPGWAPLHWAASNGDTTSARYLLSRGARINEYCPSAQATPLVIAYGKRQTPMINFLIKKGAKLDTLPENSYPSPLVGLVLHESDSGDYSSNPIDSAIIFTLHHGIKANTPISVDSSKTLLTLCILGSGRALDTALYEAKKKKIQPWSDYAIPLTATFKRADMLNKLIAFGITPVNDDAFSEKNNWDANLDDMIDSLLFTAKNRVMNLNVPWNFTHNFTAAQLRNQDSLACAYLIALKKNNINFPNQQSMNHAFTRAVRAGYHQCMDYLINEGVSVSCIAEEDDINLIALAMSINDTATMSMLIHEGKRVTTNSFAKVDTGCSCATLEYALGKLATTIYSDPQDTTNILTQALFASAALGCPQLVAALHEKGGAFTLFSAPESEEYDYHRDTLFALDKALCSKAPSQTVTYILTHDKEINKEKCAQLLDQNISTIDSTTFQAFANVLPKKQMRRIATNAIIHQAYRNTQLFEYLYRHFRKELTTKQCINMFNILIVSYPQTAADSLCKPEVLSSLTKQERKSLGCGYFA